MALDAVKMLAGALVTTKASLGKDPLSSSCGGWQLQFLTGCWTE